MRAAAGSCLARELPGSWAASKRVIAATQRAPAKRPDAATFSTSTAKRPSEPSPSRRRACSSTPPP
jgi:hypothetical protein